MAVAFDAVSSAVGSATTSLSWTHTPVGTPSAVGVGVYGFGASVSAVTYGGVSMTRSGSEITETGGTAFASIWGLANPPSGAQTVVVTCTSGYPAAGAYSVTGSDTTTCFSGAAASATGSSAGPATVNVTSATGELVIDVVGTDSGGQPNLGTNEWHQLVGGEFATGATYPGAASVTASHTLTASATWAIVAAAFLVSGGGGGGGGGGAVGHRLALLGVGS